MSSIEALTLLAAKAIRKPTAAPPKVVKPKMERPERMETLDSPIDESTSVKITMPVASLNAASVSISVASSEGTSVRRNTSSTVTTSVGATIAANRKETVNDNPANCQRTNPPTTVAMTTPAVARTTEGLITALKSGALMCIMASKIRGGTTRPTKRPPSTRVV